MDERILEKFQVEHRAWIVAELAKDSIQRESQWTESLAVGTQSYIEKIKDGLGARFKHRECVDVEGYYQLKEPLVAYVADFHPKMDVLSE